MVDHAQVGPPALAPAGAAPRVLVAHNVEHRVYDEQARAAARNGWLWRREARLMEREERILAAEAAAVWTLSEDDARAFAALGATHVAAFDVPPVSASPARPGPLEWDVALLGNWTWEPNGRGLHWFADEVLPLISAETTVAIGGAGAGWTAALPHVTY